MDFAQSYPGEHDQDTGMLLASPFVQTPFAHPSSFPLSQQHEQQQQQQFLQQRQSALPVQQQQQPSQPQHFSHQRQARSSMQFLQPEDPSYLRQPSSPPSQRSHYHYGPNPLQSPSDEVLNAAASLVLSSPAVVNGHHQALPRSQRHLDPAIGHLQHQPLEEFREVNRRGMTRARGNNVLSEWQMVPRVPRTSRSAVPVDFQWGSDVSFGASQGFSSEINEVAAESMQEEQFKVLECLEPSKSTATTRPGSPSSSGQSNQIIANSQDLLEAGNSIAQGAGAASKTSSRKKLRDGRDDSFAEREDLVVDQREESAPRVAKPTRKRTLKTERDSATPGPSRKTGAVVKRRKPSAAAAAKPPRHNLTEEEKRRHHILSEQKRRTSIKDAFVRLGQTVPALRNARFSKSNMLRLTANWAAELLAGNDELARKLEDL
ncbi:hypothetical protein ESCO_005395 [Escovopsis weberi]|uniref:BHLH domain-containing protein n=1 Tax=Escovopsis weberi TaxID=150374 RepID=A0A0M8N5W8_ESCWE|nr:hypothetical protein ESCO_005395 [Escovopsis weberi]